MYYSVLYGVFQGISIFLQVISYVILGYCLMSWFASPTNRLYVLLRNISWPFIAPFRKLSGKLMMRTGLRIDLSAWFALLVLQLLGQLIWRLFFMLVY